jgi:TRAP-type mannitol/chloroaromatic compound transport system substrate-binding protein
MRRIAVAVLGLIVAFSFIGAAMISSAAPARKGEKFGVDKRSVEWKNKRWKTSKKKFRWRMSDPWGGLLFHELAVHFADSVEAASGGRLKIKPFQTGAIVPAMETFDAVGKGTLDVGHAWPGYWKGKNEAFVLFASVPFGLDYEGYNIWYYERGGKEMMSELYGRYNLVGFFCGNTGQELGIHSNKRAAKMEDFKGMKIRTVGWYMDILTRLGASVTPLPGSEIYLALERGIIDACEYSSPAINMPMGFHEITKYVIEPGVHQPSCQCDLFINKDRWDELPDDLKAIVEICAKETQLWSYHWMENLNIKALETMGKKVEYVMMDDEALIEFAKSSHGYLEELKGKNPDVKKILDSQEEFKKDYAGWREMRGRVVPWPHEEYVEGKLTQ